MSDDEEEDWFERAMREAEGASEEDEPPEERDADATDPTGEERSDDAPADDGPADGEPEEAPASNPFGDDSDDGADPFGGGSPSGGTESDPFGGVAGSRDRSERTDPFADAPGFGEGGAQGADDAPGGFGSGEFGGDEGFGEGDEGFGGGRESFEDAELDSDIDRIDVGIEGLDEMILGGVPQRSLMVAIGAAGTGKTTFGLQFLTEALEDEGRAIYITLEESREAILSTAEEKGWPFREWRDEGRLAIVSMDPIEMANSLSSIRNDISRLVEEFNADRLVLDSVSLLEMMYDHPAQRRSEVFDFARSLKRAGVTTMLTSEASSDDPYTSRYGIIEYLVDAVFILQYVRPSDFRETRLAVEIQKIRDANHSRETKPYEITNEGISVYRQANIF
ncbi:KaiC domain-containing protein [Halolamina rubra]|uniref:KaiC domain-containing protein n=1 Tax=Halolamina rubra TaxID=1380430 RepID=UPI0006792751|nr:KaiC domain-containing protein [Halolamina rubra]